MGPELMAYARQHFPDDQSREEFLRKPLISRLAGVLAETEPIPETVTSAASAPRRSRHAQSAAKPAIHMMPFTGQIAQSMFNAKFKVHQIQPSTSKSPESQVERDRSKSEAAQILSSIETPASVKRGIIPYSDANDPGQVRAVKIAGIGTFQVPNFIC